MPTYRKQLRKLYISNFLANISISGAAWVLLLTVRGFSLIEIGFAETCFHIVSLIAEIPSGMFADVFGRRKSLMVSTIASIASCLIMAFGTSFASVCIAVGINALSYNFASGSDSALAYDSLLEAGHKEMYDRYISTQTIIYRISNGMATLLAGVAVMIGNRNAQLLGIIIYSVQFFVVFSTKENKVILNKQGDSIAKRFKDTYKGSFDFLKNNKSVAGLIFRNAIVGAVDTLLLFFLQARLPLAGVQNWVLGPLLFIMSIGGITGAFLAAKMKAGKETRLFILCIILVASGLLASFTGNPWIMTSGGFVAAFADDTLQIRSDIKLNLMATPEQRATIISINSFCFSCVMIVMSPLAGWLFSSV